MISLMTTIFDFYSKFKQAAEKRIVADWSYYLCSKQGLSSEELGQLSRIVQKGGVLVLDFDQTVATKSFFGLAIAGALDSIRQKKLHPMVEEIVRAPEFDLLAIEHSPEKREMLAERIQALYLSAKDEHLIWSLELLIIGVDLQIDGLCLEKRLEILCKHGYSKDALLDVGNMSKREYVEHFFGDADRLRALKGLMNAVATSEGRISMASFCAAPNAVKAVLKAIYVTDAKSQEEWALVESRMGINDDTMTQRYGTKLGKHMYFWIAESRWALESLMGVRAIFVDDSMDNLVRTHRAMMRSCPERSSFMMVKQGGELEIYEGQMDTVLPKV